MNSMTHQERIEFEQELREEARIEHLQTLHHERCMAEDSEYAEHYISNNLSEDFINTYHFLKKECYKYGINHTELLENL